jgi:hypothetical protein
MTHPYKVGEKVILQSPNLPEHSGEYTIEAILDTFEELTCRFTGNHLWTNEGVSYVLDVPLLDLIVCDGSEALWCGSSLRKIQEIGDMSYKELMSSLKSPVLEWN